ncbi:hypothetical protein LIER_24479 [Lithospermum erythrorhizon]|uniref:WRKY domain-containing protein n=1 Tax=Lithospermum erythrorhizon TaxID=34254 RepID=A0AAV3R166_LITER
MRSIANSDLKVVKYMYYYCSKEGFKVNSLNDPAYGKDVEKTLEASRKKQRVVKEERTGCLARIHFKYVDFDSTYVISFWADDHNHELQPPELSHHIRSNRSISFLKIDMKNFLRGKRSRDMSTGDLSILLQFLSYESKAKPSFFYDIQLDEDSLITNIFWPDGMIQHDYSCFGDVVRHQWSSVWVKSHFTAGLKSTQVSESFNPFLRDYVSNDRSSSSTFALHHQAYCASMIQISSLICVDDDVYCYFMKEVSDLLKCVEERVNSSSHVADLVSIGSMSTGILIS